MARIKIVDGSLSKLTGVFGGVPFVDGVSEDHVSKFDINRIGAALQIVDADTGERLGPQYDLLKAFDKRVPKAAPEAKPAADTKPQEKAPVELTYDFTRESLEKLVDTGGIKALRDFCAPYQVRGRSVLEIINEMLALKQAKAPSEAGADAQQSVADEGKTEGLAE